MRLLLPRKSDWTGVAIAGGDHDRLDYGYHCEGDLETFVYGHPYHSPAGGWLSAAEACQLFQMHGGSMTEQLDGAFAILFLDRRQRECIVITDPCRVYSFYYATGAEGVVISDCLKEVVTASGRRTLDERALVEFLATEMVLGEHTLFEGVQTFGGGTVSTITASLEVSTRRYWHFPDPPHGERVTLDELATEFSRHVAYGRQLSESISMPLTGGFDSRAVLAVSLSETQKFHLYTHGLPGCEDIQLATRVAQRLGLRHAVYLLGKSHARQIPERTAELVSAFDGMNNGVTYSHMADSLAREAGKGESYFSGSSGGMLKANYMPVDPPATGNLTELATIIRGCIQRRRNLAILTDCDSQQAAAIVEESIRAELERYPLENPVSLAEQFYLVNRVANYGAMNLRYIGRRFRLFDPYLGRRLLELVPRLDLDDKRQKRVHRHIITHNGGELANMEATAGKVVNRRNPMLLARSALRQGLWHASLQFRKRSGRDILRFGTIDYLRWLRDAQGDFVRQVLDPGDLQLVGVLDGPQVAQLVEDYLAGRDYDSAFIGRLITLELYLKEINRS